MYWAKPLSAEQLELMLSQFLTFGLYKSTPPSSRKRDDSPSSPRTPSPTLEAEKDEDLKQIGLGRLVTDHVTFVYISDVYIVKEHRGKGLESKQIYRYYPKVEEDRKEKEKQLLNKLYLRLYI
ncbi:hypothetical protein PRZ48_001506 [Zasmidium cellare]|uniref:Uncharacterized protein n=1 Tax=Zasmidium cellare TaxID=395010 RepID=A0ABR0F349_ZASCE|nr:hypothetical protein PRZ48_001506 [Zasmidium cellare]